MRYRIMPHAIAACFMVLLAACGDTFTAPESAELTSEATSLASGSGPRGGAVVGWNATARQLIADRRISAADVQGRILSYLSLAQYNAIVEAERVKGEDIGRSVGADIVDYSATDNFNVLSAPSAPTGPGFWYSISPTTPPRISLFGARPFLLVAGDQFRSPPPPAFGSPEFLADLAEIRAISDGRTAEQRAIAKLWGPRGPAWLNGVAAEAIAARGWNDRKAAHLLALANMAGFDAQIGCFDAKFAYWVIRPTQADPAITLAISLPNHPSYISAHSCIAASYSAVLSDAFPEEEARFTADMQLAGLSRMLGGLHYRFDITAGQELGRQVAEWAMAHDVVGHEPFPLD